MNSLYEYLLHVAYLCYDGADVVFAATSQRRFNERPGCL